MAQKRAWLAFANEDICNHRKALKELKFVNWTTNLKRNIDCVENIICLCPTCHRRIHFGSKEERKNIITSLYNKRIQSLLAVGLDISLEELLSLYQ